MEHNTNRNIKQYCSYETDGMSGVEIDKAAVKVLDEKMRVLDANWHTTISTMQDIARKQHGKRIPYEKISSNAMLFSLLAAKGRAYVESHEGMSPKTMPVDAILPIILDNVPFTLLPPSKIGARTPDALIKAQNAPIPRGFETSIYTYDFDNGIYVPASGERVRSFVSAIKNGGISDKLVSDVFTSLAVREKIGPRLLPWNPLPTWLVPVKNGVFNLVTKELEESSVYVMVAERITTDYFPGASDAEFWTQDALAKGRPYTYDRLADELSNQNPERRRLLDEICMAAVTHEYGSTQSMFFFYGKGGDGKSLFVDHGIGGMLGGDDNVAHLNLSALSNNSQLCTIDGKMAIIGGDNSPDIRIISASDRFKRMAEHRPIVVDDKYEKARAVSTDGICLQCFNQLPMFSSKESDAIVRRIVMFHAENRLSANDKVDAELEDVVDAAEADPESGREYTFRQHMLARVLSLPFRKGFSPCDKGLICDHLKDNDALGQFVSAVAEDTSVLSKDVLALPITHLYAAYTDWMADNLQGNAPMAAKAFTSAITERLEDYGFRRSPRRVNPSHSLITKTYSPALFEEYGKGKAFEAATSANRLTYYLMRDKGVDPKAVANMYDVRQYDYDCSLAEYVGVTEKARHLMDDDEKALFMAYMERQTLRRKGLDPDTHSDPEPPAPTDPTPSLTALKFAADPVDPDLVDAAVSEVASLAESGCRDPGAVVRAVGVAVERHGSRAVREGFRTVQQDGSAESLALAQGCLEDLAGWCRQIAKASSKKLPNSS